MTREEAIRWLEDIHRRFNPTGENLENEGGDVHLQALDMAIESLSSEADRPTGEWERCKKQNKADIDNGNAMYECSNCRHADLHAETQEVPYCWYCGAKMGGTE